MSDVLTAAELAAKMIQKSAEVDQAVAEYKECAIKYAAAKGDLELHHALVYPKTKGTVAEREAQAVNIVSDYVMQELHWDALRNGADRALKAHMAQLSALQSLASALREEVRMARSYGGDGP